MVDMSENDQQLITSAIDGYLSVHDVRKNRQVFKAKFGRDI